MNSSTTPALNKEPGYDFRNFYWGMEKEKILDLETAGINSEGPGFITYEDTFMGMNALVCFQFADDYLVEAGYAFYESFADEQSYIRGYEKLKHVLSSELGIPSIDENILESCSMNCNTEEKMANSNDSMMYLAEWRSERTIVRLILMGSPGNCEFGLLYMSNDYVQRIAGSGQTTAKTHQIQ